MKSFRRMTGLLLALFMLLTVVGCGDKPTESDISTDTTSSTVSDGPTVPGGAGDSSDVTTTTGTGTEKADGTTTAGGGSATAGTTASKDNVTTTTKGSSSASREYNMQDPNNPYKDMPAELKGTTVKFLMYWDPHPEDKAKFRAFEKTTGIKVKQVVSPSVTEKLTTMIAAKDSPDVVRWDSWPTSTELLQDISVAKVNKSDPVWDQSIFKATTWKGKTYGINTYGEKAINYYIVYNEDMFLDNGIKSPGEYWKNNEWNMETFEKACRDIGSLGDDIYGYCCGTRYDFVWSAGLGGVVTYKDGQFVSNLTNPAFVEAMRFVAQGCKDKIMLYDWTPGSELFNAGKLGMILSSNYGLEKEGFFKNAKFTIDAVPLPEPKGQEKYNRIYGLDAFGVAQGAKNPEGAGYFMRYYLDPAYDGLDTLFLSDKLKDFHFDQLKKCTERSLDYSGVLNLSGDVYLHSNIGWTAAQTDPQQIEVLLNTYKNMVDKGVAAGNARYG